MMLDGDVDDSDAHVVLPHPQHVRPLGSLILAADSTNLRDVSLGALVALPDELLLRVLGASDGPTLARCACASRGLRVLAYHDELWKQFLLETLPSSSWLRWDARGWRHAYLRQLGAPLPLTKAGDDASLFARGPRYHSDVLYAPWHCGTAAIPAKWSQHSSIPRVDASSLSVEDFSRRFEHPGTPVILTGVTDAWPAARAWSLDSLRARFGEAAGFHVGGHTMGLPDFVSYCVSNSDEQPLYLFDKRFRETSAAHGAALGAEYSVPAYFAASRDLFAKLPAAYRPDHAWMIIGGVRSGSGWHVDPNQVHAIISPDLPTSPSSHALSRLVSPSVHRLWHVGHEQTSAWNACVVGRKKWILTPPGHPPPGVTASDDGASVTSPISLFEWFRVFYSSLGAMRREAAKASASSSSAAAAAAAAHGRTGAPPAPFVALEATVTAGEVLFVPAGWWHCCLNLEPAIAVTGNYAPVSHARSILAYLRAGDKAGDLVSGLPDELRPLLAEQFEAVCRQHCPDALNEPAPAHAPAARAPEPVAADGANRPVVVREAQAEFRFSFG